MAALLKNIRAAYSNLRAYIPETIKTFRQDTGKELSLKNYLEVHAIEPERLLSDRTWTQWKAAAGLVPAPADQDLAVLGPAVARACQITAPGYLSAIKALPASGLSLVGEDSAAANMLYSLLWEKKGEQRGLATREEAFRPRGLHQLRGGAPHLHGLAAGAPHTRRAL